MALAAELKYCPCQRHDRRDPGDLSPFSNDILGATEVLVTIGLFTIIRLFRIVDLTVESRGFCIPRECEELSPLNPCEFFDNLAFPMNIFAPPQREDFTASDVLGFSEREEREGRREVRRDCGCDRR